MDFGGVAGEVDEDLLRGDGDVDGVAEGFDVKLAVGRELHEVQRRQVAGGVVEEHVLGARIAGVDPRRVLRGVPLVDGGVELHAGIAAAPGGVGNAAEQIAGLELFASDLRSLTLRASRTSSSRSTACMNSSVTRTELLAFWKKMEE